MEELFTFFSFPTAIRQTIYSTNLIESFNKSLKKMVRRKEQFPNEGAPRSLYHDASNGVQR
ncbi:transposase [Limosilactobacillus fermentum]|nr:transposase [Limosilactobacillus fermentum]